MLNWTQQVSVNAYIKVVTNNKELEVQVKNLKEHLACVKESTSNDGKEELSDIEKVGQNNTWGIRYNQLRQFRIGKGDCRVTLVY